MTQDEIEKIKYEVEKTILRHNKFEGFGRLFFALKLDNLFYTSDLTPRERELLKMRFGFEDGITHTLEEVAKEFGVTRERIRQMQAKALEKLRREFRQK